VTGIETRISRTLSRNRWTLSPLFQALVFLALTLVSVLLAGALYHLDGWLVEEEEVREDWDSYVFNRCFTRHTIAAALVLFAFYGSSIFVFVALLLFARDAYLVRVELGMVLLWGSSLFLVWLSCVLSDVYPPFLVTPFWTWLIYLGFLVFTIWMPTFASYRYEAYFRSERKPRPDHAGYDDLFEAIFEDQELYESFERFFFPGFLSLSFLSHIELKGNLGLQDRAGVLRIWHSMPPFKSSESCPKTLLRTRSR